MCIYGSLDSSKAVVHSLLLKLEGPSVCCYKLRNQRYAACSGSPQDDEISALVTVFLVTCIDSYCVFVIHSARPIKMFNFFFSLRFTESNYPVYCVQEKQIYHQNIQ